MKAYGGGPRRAFDAQLVESARSFLFFRNGSDNPFAAPILMARADPTSAVGVGDRISVTSR